MITRENIRELANFEAKQGTAVSFYYQPHTPKDKSHREEAILVKDLVRAALRGTVPAHGVAAHDVVAARQPPQPQSAGPVTRQADEADAIEFGPRDVRDAAVVPAGEAAVRAAIDGQSGVMVTIERVPGPGYASVTGLVPLERVAGVERGFPREWIDETGHDVRPAFLAWASPLVGPLAPDAEIES